MKTVFLFYLNSLGIALVLTQTRQPLLTDCKLTKAGHEYAGPLNVTRSGRVCERWDSDKSRFKDSKLYPEGSATAAGNKCRNPYNENKNGVWCYTNDPKKKWEYCDVDFCSCKLTKEGREYAGSLNVTRSGWTCQRWDTDYPHYSNFKLIKDSKLYPEGSATAAGNKCRNPDSQELGGAWCYTTDPGKRWDYCDVDFCTLDCKLTMSGHDYAGPLNITKSGRTCERWDSDQSNFKNSTLYPEGNATAAGNKCRNPDSDNKTEGVWCYTNDSAKKWEYCNVNLCHILGLDCKLTMAGHEYAGPLSTTISGQTCQRWDSDYPHHSNFKDSKLYPEGNATAAGNKCRNPYSDKTDGVWCYTTNPTNRWENCAVDFCRILGIESIEIMDEGNWQAIILPSVFGGLGLLVLTTGIFLCLYRKRCNATIKEMANTENTAIPQPSSTDQGAMDVRGDGDYEYIDLDSEDPLAEEAKIQAERDQPTKRSKEADLYMALAPDRTPPLVYAALSAANYIDIRN